MQQQRISNQFTEPGNDIKIKKTLNILGRKYSIREVEYTSI